MVWVASLELRADMKQITCNKVWRRKKYSGEQLAVLATQLAYNTWRWSSDNAAGAQQLVYFNLSWFLLRADVSH